LLNRFDEDRPALPALTLGTDSASVTAIAQSIGISEIFSRQLRALGQEGDVLLCINSSIGTGNLLRAVQTAQERNMGVVMMSNVGDSEIGTVLRPEDVELRVDATQPARIVELHTMVIHHFCELIDHSLFGTYNRD
jgi:phosphoheptose isomerase